MLDDYKDGGFKLSPSLRAAFDRERTSANVLSGFGATWGSPTWTFYVESGVSRYLPVLGRFGALRFRDAQNYRYSPDLGIIALRDEPATMTAYRVEGMNPASGEMRDLAFAGRWKKRGPVGLPLQVGLDMLSARRPLRARAHRRRSYRRPEGRRNEGIFREGDRMAAQDAPLLAGAEDPGGAGRPAGALGGVGRARALRAFRRSLGRHG